MIITILYLFFVNCPTVWLIRSRAPVPKTIWDDKCNKHSLALNDCNWCRCANSKYICTARACDTVDMFGHFNDAITNTIVGMEGKGSWRSTATLCQPGVHYRKDELLCICNEDGGWPNPVCRDIFQLLHTVEPTKYEQANNQICSPNKLYQIGCNICYCDSTGLINSNLCTQKDCNDNINSESMKKIRTKTKRTMPVQVYASCTRGKIYKIDCQTCVCLPYNRLLCDNCTAINFRNAKSNDHLELKQNDIRYDDVKYNQCSDSIPGQRFKVDCNICYCDKKDIIYCTVFKCLRFGSKLSIPEINYQIVDAPVDDHDCVPTTKYRRDCNICFCFILDDVKYFGCTLKMCYDHQLLIDDGNHCNDATKYERNCLICQCIIEKGLKREICTFNDKCKSRKSSISNNIPTQLESMHGYCEPLHNYLHGCNKCKCLSNGQTVACTSKICSKKPLGRSILVEFIPFIQKGSPCPSGHSYKVDCNVCHCLLNGDTICTTKACKPNELK